MEKNLLNNNSSNSVEQPVKAVTETAVLPQMNGFEEIVLYDECGDTLWGQSFGAGCPAKHIETAITGIVPDKGLYCSDFHH